MNKGLSCTINFTKMSINKVVIGGDHAGFDLKEIIKEHLIAHDYDILDVGTHSNESTDYPDYAHPLANIVEEESILGILICGSANGVCMTANKHQGIRAAIAWLPELAMLAKQHNNANVICIPSRFIEEEVGIEIVDMFLNTPFEGGRHEKRVNKIAQS